MILALALICLGQHQFPPEGLYTPILDPVLVQEVTCLIRRQVSIRTDPLGVRTSTLPAFCTSVEKELWADTQFLLGETVKGKVDNVVVTQTTANVWAEADPWGLPAWQWWVVGMVAAGGAFGLGVLLGAQ